MKQEKKLAKTIDLLLSPLKKRSQDILRYYYHLAEMKSNKSKVTLALIGKQKQYKLSRERIRQIIEITIATIKKSNHFLKIVTPVRNKLVNLLTRYGGLMAANDVYSHWQKESLSLLEQNALRFIALVLSKEQIEKIQSSKRGENIWKLRNNQLILFQKASEEFKKILQTTKQTISLNKLTTLFKKTSFYRQHQKELASQVINNFLKISPLIGADIFNQVGLTSWPIISPRRMRDKAYVVMKKTGRPIHFREITQLIKKHYYDQQDVHVPTVHNELISDERFVLIGRGTYALHEWGYQTGKTVDLIKQLLTIKKELTRDDIYQAISKQRLIKKGTIAIILNGRSETFNRLPGKKYRLKKK